MYKIINTIFSVSLLFFISISLSLRAGPYDDYLKTGRDHLNLFHYKEACDFFKKAVEVNPSKAEAYYFLGITQRKLNNIDVAITSLEKALAIDSSDLDTQKALAGIYIKLAKDFRESNNRGEMLKFLKKSIYAYPQNTSGAVTLFDMLAREQKWDEIISLAERFKKLNKDAIDAGDDKNLQISLTWIAQAFFETKQMGKAREFVRAAGMIRNPNDHLARLQKSLPEETKIVTESFAVEAKELINKGDLKNALEKLKLAQSANPDDMEVKGLLEKTQDKIDLNSYLQKAEESEKAGNFPEALENLNRAIGLDEENATLRKKAEELNNKLDAAEKIKAQKRNAELAEKKAVYDREKKLNSLLKAAKENETRGSFDSAKIIYEQALQMAPERKDIQVLLDATVENSRKMSDRIEKIGKNLSLASKMISEEKHDEAFALLKDALEEKLASKTQIYPLIIETAIKLNLLDQAEMYSDKYSDLASTSPQLKYYKALIAFKNEKYPEAGELLSAIPKTFNDHSGEISSMKWTVSYHKYKYGLYLFILIFGWKVVFWIISEIKSVLKSSRIAKLESLLSNGKYDQAISIIESCLNNNEEIPNRKAVITSLSDAYLKVNRPHDAKEKALEVLAKDPKNAVASRVLGEASFQLADTSSEGIERITSLLKIDENRKDVIGFLTNYYKSNNYDSKQATDIYHKYLILFPDDADTLLYLAEIYLKRSYFSSTSQKIFEKASKYSPDKPEFLHSYAQCLIQSGKKDEGEKVMEAGAKKWPDSSFFVARKFQTETTSSQKIALKPNKISLKTPTTTYEDSDAGDSPAIAFKMPTNQAKKPSAGEGILCKNCNTENNTREYYCTKCGKPLA
ncbi:MAG: tetratricopeptide repeat protein [Candidatus Riflebacteria bacterium]|nr:tetratricopeptide repeat protein [Candidatus Riflebacteria bacterium]